MKKFLFILFAHCALFSFSIEWSPVGVTWVYRYHYMNSGGDTDKLSCDSTSIFRGKVCQAINRFSAVDDLFFKEYDDPLYTYESNDTIFFYNPNVEQFEVLYDFHANKGDQWTVTGNIDGELKEVIVKVDSVDFIEINDELLKRLYVN